MADDVGADDPKFVLHRARQGVEVASLARDAVNAHQHPVARAVPPRPFPVRHAAQACRTEALDAAQLRLGRSRRRHFICTVPLTVAVTIALPGSTDKDSPLDGGAAAACIRIIGTGEFWASLVDTVTSRTATSA